MLFAVKSAVEGATCHIAAYGWRQSLLIVKVIESSEVYHDKQNLLLHHNDYKQNSIL